MKIKLKNNQIILEGMRWKPYKILGLDESKNLLIIEIPQEIKGYEHFDVRHSTSRFLVINIQNGKMSNAIPKNSTNKNITSIDELQLPNTYAFVEELPPGDDTLPNDGNSMGDRIARFLKSNNFISPNENEEELINKNHFSKVDTKDLSDTPQGQSALKRAEFSPEEKVKRGVGSIPSSQKQFQKLDTTDSVETKKDYSRMKRKKNQFNKLDFDDKSDLIEQKLPFKNFKFKLNNGK